MESSHFLAISSPCSTLQNFFLDFWFRPPNAQNLLPNICTKSPISRLVWQIDRRCLGLPGGFRRWPIPWNHAKCWPTTMLWANPCCHGNEIWARRGDQVAYRLVCNPSRSAVWCHSYAVFYAQDATKLSSCVASAVSTMYVNSQLAHDDCRRIQRCERSRRPWPSLQLQPML